MDGVTNLVANNQVVCAASGCLESFVVRFLGGLFVLLFADKVGTYVASVIEALATLIEVQLVFKQWHDVPNEHMLTNTPVLNELDEGNVPAVAQGTDQ